MFPFISLSKPVLWSILFTFRESYHNLVIWTNLNYRISSRRNKFKFQINSIQNSDLFNLKFGSILQLHSICSLDPSYLKFDHIVSAFMILSFFLYCYRSGQSKIAHCTKKILNQTKNKQIV